MEFQDVVRRRKMVRDYATDPVDPAIIERATRNAVRAPNAGFSQGWGFLVLAQPDKGWTDEDEARWPVPFWHIDTGMAALLILQTVTDEGLGACYFGVPPERVAPVRAAFGIPDTFDPIGAITIGHRTTTDGLPGSPSVRPRKAQADVVHHGRWGT